MGELFNLYDAERHVTTTISIKSLQLEGTHSNYVSSGLEGFTSGHNLVFLRLLLSLFEKYTRICVFVSVLNITMSSSHGSKWASQSKWFCLSLLCLYFHIGKGHHEMINQFYWLKTLATSPNQWMILRKLSKLSKFFVWVLQKPQARFVQSIIALGKATYKATFYSSHSYQGIVRNVGTMNHFVGNNFLY